ncbi:MAG: hypothetical protein HFE86_02570 [Clostridiales bacterium]|nr:hypothetical protein [Clostridiales bacterium]
MKKIISLCLAIGLLCSLSACNKTENEAENVSNQTSGASAMPTDYTKKLSETVDISGKQIQGAYSAADRLKIYETISDLSESADGIIRGEILAVSYFHIDTVAYTKMDIKVKDVLAGSLQAGDQISVYKSGGFIGLHAYLPDIQERVPEITIEEIENTVVDVSNEGDPHPEIGQEAVFFLYASTEDDPPVLSGMYGIVGDYSGQFTRDENDAFSRHIQVTPEPVSTPSGLTGYSLPQYAEIDRSGKTGADRIFTFEELKLEIQSA